MSLVHQIIHQARDSTNIIFWYGKKNPATGTYYNSSSITAAQISLFDKAGTQLLAPTAMSFVSNLRGYIYEWTPGSALDSLDIIFAFIAPTTTEPRALVPDELVPINVTDLKERQDELEADIGSIAQNRNRLRIV